MQLATDTEHCDLPAVEPQWDLPIVECSEGSLSQDIETTGLFPMGPLEIVLYTCIIMVGP